MTKSQTLEMEATFSSVTLEVKRILHGVVFYRPPYTQELLYYLKDGVGYS
jgi:hypothetical protein